MSIATLANDVGNPVERGNRHARICMQTDLVGHVIICSRGTTDGIVRAHTTDGGKTWAALVSVNTGADWFNPSQMASYYSQFSPILTTTDIWFTWVNAGGDQGSGLFFDGLNVASHTRPSGHSAFQKLYNLPVSQGDNLTNTAVCITPSGRIYAMFTNRNSVVPNGTVQIFSNTTTLTSSDNVYSQDITGANQGDFGGIDIEDIREVRICPSPTDNDAIMIFVYTTNSRIQMREFDSVDGLRDGAWTTIDNTGGQTSLYANFDIAMRHSDQTIFLVYWTRDATLQDGVYRAKQILTSTTFASLMQIQGPTPSEDSGVAAIGIDQTLGHIYAAYQRGPTINFGAGGDSDGYFRRSVNSGSTWGPEEKVNPTAATNDSYNGIIGFTSTPGADINGSLVFALIVDDTPSRIVVDDDAVSTPLGKYTVRATDDGGADATPVACETGMPAQGVDPNNDVILSPERYPNHTLSKTAASRVEKTIWMEYSSTRGTWVVGDKVQGLTSLATGIILGFLDNPNRLGIRSIKSGPGPGRGSPFIPGETVQNLDTLSTDITLGPQPSSTPSQNPAAAAGGADPTP